YYPHVLLIAFLDFPIPLCQKKKYFYIFLYSIPTELAAQHPILLPLVSFGPPLHQHVPYSNKNITLLDKWKKANNNPQRHLVYIPLRYHEPLREGSTPMHLKI